ELPTGRNAGSEVLPSASVTVNATWYVPVGRSATNSGCCAVVDDSSAELPVGIETSAQWYVYGVTLRLQPPPAAMVLPFWMIEPSLVMKKPDVSTVAPESDSITCWPAFGDAPSVPAGGV